MTLPCSPPLSPHPYHHDKVLVDSAGELHIVRRRQGVEQISENEMPLTGGIV